MPAARRRSHPAHDDRLEVGIWSLAACRILARRSQARSTTAGDCRPDVRGAPRVPDECLRDRSGLVRLVATKCCALRVAAGSRVLRRLLREHVFTPDETAHDLPSCDGTRTWRQAQRGRTQRHGRRGPRRRPRRDYRGSCYCRHRAGIHALAFIADVRRPPAPGTSFLSSSSAFLLLLGMKRFRAGAR